MPSSLRTVVRICRLLLLLPVCAALSDCASAQKIEPVALAPNIGLQLPPYAGLGKTEDVMQIVTMRHDDDSYSFEVRLSATEREFLMVGTDMMGRRLMRIRWQGDRVEVDRASWLPEQVHPENILADIMLLYWPEGAVRSAIVGAELESGPGWRSIRRKNEEVIAITVPATLFSGTARLKNFGWHYEIEIQSESLGS